MSPAATTGTPLVSATRTMVVGLSPPDRLLMSLASTGTNADTRREPKDWVSFSTGMSRSPSVTTEMVSV